MTQLRFSVVIPTRNRDETLRSALATCLDQQFDNYEILVCDNGNGSEAEQVVREANSPRIRYLAPTQPLAMSANWERAVTDTRGEYVTVLGDDDGLMPYALLELDALITAHAPQAIAWQRGIYTWPAIGIEGEADLLRMPVGRDVYALNGPEQIAKAIRFEAGTDTLPMIYSAVVHRDLIARHRELAGRVFLNVYPDVYSAFGLGYLANRYLYTSVPMSIAGLSKASNGVATLMNTSGNAVSTDFDRLNAAFGYVRHPKVPDKMILGPVHVMDCFLHAKDALFPDDDTLVLDRKDFTLRCLAAVFDVDAGQREQARKVIRASLADDKELLHWFDTEAPDLPPGRIFSLQPQRLGFDGVFFNLRTAAYGVTDIAGAVTFATRLLGFDTGRIAYDLDSWPQLHRAAASARALAETQAQASAAELARAQTELSALRDQAEQTSATVQALQRQLEDERTAAAAVTGILQHQLGEAYHAASLRYVPHRLLAKLTGRPAKGEASR